MKNNKIANILAVLLLTTSLNYCSEPSEEDLALLEESDTDELDDASEEDLALLEESDTDELDDAIVLTFLENAIQGNNIATIQELIEQNPNAIERIIANRDPNAQDIIREGLYEAEPEIAIVLARAGFATMQELLENSEHPGRPRDLLEAGADPTEGMTDQETIQRARNLAENNLDETVTMLLAVGPNVLNPETYDEYNDHQAANMLLTNTELFTSALRVARERQQFNIINQLEDRGFNVTE